MGWFHCTASYETPRGGGSWQAFDLSANDISEAQEKATRRVGKRAARALDIQILPYPENYIPSKGVGRAN